MRNEYFSNRLIYAKLLISYLYERTQEAMAILFASYIYIHYNNKHLFNVISFIAHMFMCDAARARSCSNIHLKIVRARSLIRYTFKINNEHSVAAAQAKSIFCFVLAMHHTPHAD